MSIFRFQNMFLPSVFLLTSCATGPGSAKLELEGQGRRWQSEEAFNQAVSSGDAKDVGNFLKANGGLWGELARVQRTTVDESSIFKSKIELRGVLSSAILAVANDRVQIIDILAPYMNQEELTISMLETAWYCKATPGMLEKFYDLGIKLSDDYPGYHLKQGKGWSGPLSCPSSLKVVVEKQPDLLPKLLNSTAEQLETFLSKNMVAETYRKDSTLYLEKVVNESCDSSDSGRCKGSKLFAGLLKRSREKQALMLESQEKRENAYQKQLEYQASPAGLKSSICQLQRGIIFHEQQVKQEQQISQTSGVINAAKVHEHAGLALELKRQQAPFLNQYVQKTGRAFNAQECNAH